MMRTLMRLFRSIGRVAKATVGLPNYEAYLEHMARRHPDRLPMDYAAFFKNRQQARYDGKKAGRCC